MTASPGAAANAVPPFFSGRLQVGIALSAACMMVAAVSALWTPRAIEAMSMQQQLLPPGGDHWLGTDQLNRDSLSVLMVSLRGSLGIAIFAAAIGLLLGTPLGLLSVRWPGALHAVLYATRGIPKLAAALVVAIVLAALSEAGSVNALLALGIVDAAVVTLAVGSGLAAFRGADYLAAARLAGSSRWTAAQLHLLPRLTPYLLMLVVQLISFGLVAEATLSYAGLGATAPGMTLGSMLREAQGFLLLEPRLSVVPGLGLLLCLCGLALTASGLRLMLDPALQRLEPTHGVA